MKALVIRATCVLLFLHFAAVGAACGGGSRSPAAPAPPAGPAPQTGSVADTEGNTYNTVLVGQQWWMAENLRVTRDPAGNSIVSRVYNDDAGLEATYGRLYSQRTAMDGSRQPGARGLCPSGWHVPSDGDWRALFTAVGGEAVAGSVLKEAGTVHWNPPNAGATNASGFTGRPGGGFNGASFQGLGVAGHFWSSTGDGAAASLPTPHTDYAAVLLLSESASLAHSVRCVRGP